MKHLKNLALLFITAITAISCSDDDDNHAGNHEEELITTVTYTLTNTADSSDVVTLEFEDLDGEGGAAGTYDISGALRTSSTYTGAITLSNATETPAEDITAEIQAEKEEHEFFFTPSITGVVITKTDQDSNGNPVGLATSLTTGAAGTGSITIVLKHEPTKPNDNTASGAGGSTDLQVTFTNVNVVAP